MVNDYLNGIIVGIAQTLIGHPLDTLKILRQTKNNINYNTLNIRGLYRGMIYPMCGSGIFNSIQFGTYQYLNDIYHNNMIAGLGAGLLSGMILCPIDVLKINKQIKNKSYKKLHLYRGLYATCGREIPSTYIYFTTYYSSMNYLEKNNEMNAFLSGGIAGVLSWFFTFPIDVVKTRIQSYQFDTIGSAINHGNLWNGLTVCLVRAFIVNGTGFVVYNKLSNI
tara:strand:+ start:1693 stop:2358 length:666 start_codon:yes stop_codon:yes gene_type:complete